MSRGRFTTLPCGLKLRLDVQDGNFELRGDTGSTDNPGTDDIIHWNIDVSPHNLMALSAFFLARAQESSDD